MIQMALVGDVVRVLVICSFAFGVHGFNFEDRNPIVKRGEKGSYFGYSVAEHKSSENGGIEDNWILVGAPLGQNLQPLTNRSGALFKCPVTERNTADCVQVQTDGRRHVSGRYRGPNDFEYDDVEDSTVTLYPPGNEEIKNGQWMGVNVRSQGPGGKVMVCAHRYITGTITTTQHGVGLCYSLDRNLEWEEEHEPCKGRPMTSDHQQFGFCQAGTSLALLDDGTAVIGSPGPFTWRGTMFVLSIVGDFLSKDKNIYLGPLNDKPEPIDKYSYLGMSVTAGHFLTKKITSYAAGAPRSQNHGQVYIFNKMTGDKFVEREMNISLIINGEQFASNFGYEITSLDINKDGYDDLAVAAPFYFTETQGGAVYIYYDVRSCTEHECNKQILYGPLESRFGFAMTALGDINKDGYTDMAIGAPYEGGGAIYIYLGSKNGLNPKYSQKIHPEAYDVRTVGYSLSGGMDMDNNGYPDLLTGAYDSDTVILFKARPIIDIQIEISGKELRNINISRSGCKEDSRTNNTCFSFQSCFTISSAEAKTRLENVTVKSYIEAELFDGRKFSRIWFKKNISDVLHAYVSKYFTLTDGNRRYCQQETVFIKEGTRDILSPIKFRVNYTLANNEENSPILNQTSVKVFEATFQKDCGEDDVCQSNLVLSAKLSQFDAIGENRYLLNLGGVDEIILQVNVTNMGESAYEAELYIAHPDSLSYIALDKLANIECTTINDTMVTCSLGNPLPSYKSLVLGLRFESKKAINKMTELEFNIFVNSTSKELSKQTSATLYAIVKKLAEVHIRGSASPQHVVFGGDVKGESAMEYFEDIGTRIWHTYQVINDGPWYVENLLVNIHWPWQVENDKPQGKWLLYLEEMPFIEGRENGYCWVGPSQAVNLLNLTGKSDAYDSPPDNLLMPPIDLNQSDYGLSSMSRRKRDTEFVIPPKIDKNKRKVVTMDCNLGTAKCVNITCNIYKLGRGNEATIRIKSRIWNSTLVEDYNQVDWVKIVSRAEINFLDENIEQNTLNDITQVETIAYPDIRVQDGSVSLLVIIGAILAGILLLIILIVILWKLGFFKRNRVNDPTLTGNLTKQSENETLLQ